VPIYHLNTNLFNMSYTEAFPTGTSLAVQWNNNRQTSNSPENGLNPVLNVSRASRLCNRCWRALGLGLTCAF